MSSKGMRSLFVSVLIASLPAVAAHAHQPGPPLVVLEVGESFVWTITADLTEVLTVYTPVELPNPAVATLSPETPFTAHDGAYIITAVAPGEASFQVKWFYEPTEAGATVGATVVVNEPQSQLSLSGRAYLAFARLAGENTLLYLDFQPDGKLLVAKIFPAPDPGGPDFGQLAVCAWSENLADHSFNGAIVNEALQLEQRPGLAILVGGELAPPDSPDGGTLITGNALIVVTPDDPEVGDPILLGSPIYGFEIPAGMLPGVPLAGGF